MSSALPIPTWVKEHLDLPKGTQYYEQGNYLRIRGRDSDPDKAATDCMDLVELDDPEGFKLSEFSCKSEHARGRRKTWSVSWVRVEHADRLYAQNQEERKG